MLSPGSRGKGGRRGPWRDGGRRKQKAVVWHKRASHAVEDVSQLPGELIELSYYCPFGLAVAESIYLFDQEAARTGFRYYAELKGTRSVRVFKLRVPVDHAEAAGAIIARLEKR